MSGGVVYKNKAAALRWLHERGHNVGKSKFYADVRKGLVALEPDGGIGLKALETYAKLLLVSTPGRPSAAPDLSEDSQKLLAAKAAEKEYAAKLNQMKYERLSRQLVDRSEVERFAAQAVVSLKTALNQWIVTSAPRLVEVARGDTARARTVLERILASQDAAVPEALRLEAVQALALGARDMAGDVVVLMVEESRRFFHGFSKARLIELVYEGDALEAEGEQFVEESEDDDGDED